LPLEEIERIRNKAREVSMEKQDALDKSNKASYNVTEVRQ
jgi:hypothetical protein